MKTLFTLLFVAFALVHISAQTPAGPDTVPPPTNPQQEDTTVYAIVEGIPMFPGGDSAWRAYVQNSIRYPVIARDKGEQGTVYVQFVVEPDGSVTNCVVRKHPNSEALAAEALRIVSASPRWIPGTQNGKALRVKMTMPIKFVLPQ